MNEKKKFLKADANSRTAAIFWGNIAFAILLLILSLYGLVAIFSEDTNITARVGQVLYGLNCVALVISLVFLFRSQPERGLGLASFTGLGLVFEGVLLLQQQAVAVTIALLITALVCYFWLYPPQWRRRLTVTTAISVALIWMIELLDPAWRISFPGRQLGPEFVILIGLVTAAILFFQATKTSIRSRLIYGFLMVTIIPLIVTAVLNDRNTRAVLTEDANLALLGAASQTAARVDSFIDGRLNISRSEAQFPVVIDYIILPANRRAGSLEEASINKFLYARLSEDPVYINSVAVYDINGITLADTVASDIGINKSDEAWFQNAVANGLPYASEVVFSHVGDTPALYFSAPVRDSAGRIIGVIRTRYDASILQSILTAETKVAGESSFPILIDIDSHLRLAHGTTPSLVFKTVAPQDASTVQSMQEESILPPGTPEEISTNLPGFRSALLAFESQPFFTTEFAAYNALGNQRASVVETKYLDWLVVYAVSESEFIAPINAQARTSIILTVLAGLVVAGFALFIAQSLAGPITRLTITAETIAGGDITMQAKVETSDEIGTLATTFNRMTQQLRDFINTLESRVADRTRNLELAAEVGRTVSQVRSLDVMLTDAAELIRTQFDLYYVQVYLTDPSQTNLLLLAGTGKVGEELLGRSHQLPLNISSINGRAATEKKSAIISDTTASATFRPNPLLPNTRSEMAVPLLVGEKVVGVLDLQSEKANALTQEILPAFEALAGQLAIAIQNANLLAETEQARAVVEAQARRLVRANWADYMDAIHKPEETGFVFERNKISTMTQDEAIEGNSLVAPISVTGETLGNLVVEMEGQSQGTRAAELVDTVARQVAQHIEGLRLLESAERYRAESEQASRRLTREGWKTYVEHTDESLSYFYDLKEVQPYVGDGQSESAVALPLKVRDEVLGKLAIQGLDANDGQAVELVNAVAARLSAHIESLRQFEETRRGQVELDRRAQQLSAVAEISTASSKELDIQKMLESVVDLTQRKFGLYHAHVFTYNEYTDELQIVACGWEAGNEHEGTHEAVSIPLSREQSLVARAARTRQSVIVNDVQSEPGFLANPLLPDTASEMAVPLVIGDQVLGVLDVQSDQVNAFTEEDANIQTTLASQVATALQNARSFARAQQQAARESTLNVIGQKIQSATSVEAVLQIAARELGHALGAPMTVAQLSMKDKS